MDFLGRYGVNRRLVGTGVLILQGCKYHPANAALYLLDGLIFQCAPMPAFRVAGHFLSPLEKPAPIEAFEFGLTIQQGNGVIPLNQGIQVVQSNSAASAGCHKAHFPMGA